MSATTATSAPCAPEPNSPEKVLIINGSPHKDGAAARLLSLLLGESCLPLTRIDCFARTVAACDDCRGCFHTRGCVKRDIDDIYTALEDADCLIFATPVYNRSFPAPMKALLDRFQCYWAARFIHGKKPPIEKPKTAVLLTVCGSGRDDGLCLEEQLAPLLTVLNARLAGAVHLTGTDRAADWDAIKSQIETLKTAAELFSCR